MPQPGRPQRRPQKRRLRTDPAPAQPALTEDDLDFDLELVDEAPHPAGRPVSTAAVSAIRDRRRTRSHVRDYSYVRAEVRLILAMSAAVIIAITLLSFALR